MTGSKRRLVLCRAALALAAIMLTRRRRARERRAPYGMDALMLETQVRESIERRINPLLEQMAPGQAELKYVDVRVGRPTAQPGTSEPGFEDTAPGAAFVAEKAEVSLVLDAKLPAPFRKDLKNLIKNRLDSLAVPIDIKESVIAFPTPRPQPTVPPEIPFRYPPMPQMPAQQPQVGAVVAAHLPTEPTPAARRERDRAWALLAGDPFPRHVRADLRPGGRAVGARDPPPVEERRSADRHRRGRGRDEEAGAHRGGGCRRSPARGAARAARGPRSRTAGDERAAPRESDREGRRGSRAGGTDGGGGPAR
jgi:hypothetical protein